MCGIVAILSQVEPIRLESLERAMGALSHRGPDGQGQWRSTDGCLALGHRRLSIIDHLTGGQPIASEDDQVQIVANGEFYDFERLRLELQAGGHLFRTQSDTEVALHLYEQHGLAFVQRLRGEFAFVLWDGRRRRLIAARDRFGVKPLYYARHRDAVYFASEAKALFAAGVPAAWDEEAIYRQLFMSFRRDHSLFDKVRQIPAGYMLVHEAGAVRLQRYWNLGYPRYDPLQKVPPRQELAEHTRCLLEESIRLRLRADVPVGVLLSGGLDSSSVLGIASHLSPVPLTAFSIAFPHAAFDESPVARRTAEQFHADFQSVLVRETDIADHFGDSVWHGEMVQYNAHGTARYLLTRHIRDAGHKVVLGGEGADELFAGYDFLRAAPHAPNARFAARWLRVLYGLARPASPAERVVAQTSPWLARLVKAFNLPASLVAGLADRLSRMRSLLAPDFLSRFRRLDPYHELYQDIDGRHELPGREYVKQVLYVWLKTFFANYHLAADRIDMAHAVEVRLPYLDHELFEYGSQLPTSVLTVAGVEKALLREAARPHLPDWIYHRRKKPFLAPPADLQPGGALFAFFQDTLRGATMQSVPFFDYRAVTALLDGLSALAAPDRARLDPFFLILASMCVLHHRLHL